MRVWRRLPATLPATLPDTLPTTVRGAMAGTVAVAAALLVAPVPAFAAHVCDTLPGPSQVAKGTPYEDQLYAPKLLAPLATGAGVRVAVIDSGVDADHPQLRGQVDKGRDFLHGGPDGRQDCVGHGTGVASLIAAKPADDTGFQGLAPGATIVPIRISEERDTLGKTAGDHGSLADLAAAIDWAAGDGHAQVINLSLVTTEDNTAVRAAVRRALAKGVVIVAAAGNDGGPQDGNPTPYPASYDGVIGVGAITADGVRASFSQHGDYVDLVAVGENVTVASLGSGHHPEQGTSFAAPLVAATAALIKQRYPGATPAEVTRRLLATADPAPGGEHSDDYGYGLLDPYRAVTETLGPEFPAAPVPVVMHADDPAALALAVRRDHAQDMALLIAALGAGAVLLIGVAAVIVRRGRRRGWHPATPGDTALES